MPPLDLSKPQFSHPRKNMLLNALAGLPELRGEGGLGITSGQKVGPRSQVSANAGSRDL